MQQNVTMTYKPKSILLKDIPEDIYKEILRVQGDEKTKRSVQFSLDKTVFKIIKSTIKDKQ